jgi:hypothetical protein
MKNNTFFLKNIQILSIILIFNACTNSSTNSNIMEKPSTDVKGLKELLRFSLESQKVTWVTTYAENKNDYSVDAIIECTEADLVAIKALNSKKYESQVYLNKDGIHEWLPEEIKKKFIMEDGYYTPDEKLFDAGALVKSPLSNGYFFLYGKYLYLSCFTM